MHRPHVGIVAAVLLALLGTAFAQDAQPDSKELETTIEALKARIKDQGDRLAQMESVLTEVQKQQLSRAEMEKIAREMAADAAKRSGMPKWLDGLKFFGDVRLRYDGQCFNNDLDTRDRNRFRYRLRFGLVRTWLDGQLETGFQLASGEYKVANGGALGSDATSTNQTFTDNFTEKPIWIDRVWAAYRPKFCPGLEIIGGKIANPLVHTDMVWDSDVNPEGFFAGYKYKVACLEPFVGVAYFTNSESSSGYDSTLLAYQAGSRVEIAKDVVYTFAATLYDWDHYDTSGAAANGNHSSAISSGALGFKVVNLTNSVDWRLCNLPWKAYFDYACNCDNHDPSPDYADQSHAYAVGLGVGKNKRAGDWSIGYAYKYIEANAVPGAFNDSDFGFADRKGHVLKGVYNITDFLTIGAALFYTEPIVGSSSKPVDNRDTTVLVDLIWKM